MDAKQLIELLNAAGYTQYRIAKDLGIPQGTLSRLRRSITKSATYTTVVKLRNYAINRGVL